MELHRPSPAFQQQLCRRTRNEDILAQRDELGKEVPRGGPDPAWRVRGGAGEDRMSRIFQEMVKASQADAPA